MGMAVRSCDYLPEQKIISRNIHKAIPRIHSILPPEDMNHPGIGTQMHQG
jgi:hypothetical protein